MWKINENAITLLVVIIVIFAVAVLVSALADRGVHTLLQLLRF